MTTPRFCADCGTEQRAGARFCRICGVSQVFGVVPWAATPLPWGGAHADVGLRPVPDVPAQLSFAVSYPGRQWWLTVLVRPLLAGPHLAALAILSVALVVTSALGWVAILLLGRLPRPLWRFGRLYLRWYGNVLAYAALLRDEYPPFGGGAYPVEMMLPETYQRNRASAFFRGVLVLVPVLLLAGVQLVWLAVWWIAWAMTLVGGEHPLGLWRFGQGAARWTLRVLAYATLLTDADPPASLANAETPGVLPPVITPRVDLPLPSGAC